MKRVLLVLLLLTFAIPASAQDDPTALVLDAFARLEEGYRFTYTADASQTYDGDSSDETTSYDYRTTGEVDADGSYIGSTTLEGTGTNGEQTLELGFEFERAHVNGVDYVRLGEDRTAAPYFEDIEDGWHRLDDLESTMEDSIYHTLLGTLTTLNLPSDLPLEERLITSIAEVEPTEIDGVPVRGFEVVIDGLQAYRDSILEAGTVSLENLVDVAMLLDAGEYEYTATLWIGSDDGRLYRIEGEYYTFVPYSTVSVETDTPLPPFDHTQTGTFRFNLTDHGAVDPIAPPIS